MSENQAKETVNDVYLSLGANIDPINNLEKAIEELSKNAKLVSVSSFWSGPPIGIDGPDFVNGAVHVQTGLSLHSFKRDVLRKIEGKMGRERSANKYAPRPIDIDILLYNKLEIDIDLWRYAYLAVPMAEIHPNYSNPRGGELLSEKARLLHKESGLFLASQERK